MRLTRMFSLSPLVCANLAARQAAASIVNQVGRKYPLKPRPAPKSVLKAAPKLDVPALLAKHANTRPLSAAEMQQTLLETTLLTWGPSRYETLQIDRAEGIYLYDKAGKKYLDFNSGAMCANMGHTVPPAVIAAIVKQLQTVPYAYPCHQSVEVKARLGALLKDLCPGDINQFFFTSGGADANEAALRMAKMYTKRPKVMARYRSYHGGTIGTMALTGDPRRWATEPSLANVVRVLDPDPYHVSFGKSEEEITANNLTYLEEVIKYEGGHNISAFFLESVTGTNGVLKPPRGYLEGVRALCDAHGILMVCDEVMAGFGRTGKLFGFMHSDPCVVPDIVTMAKGINGAFVPLGCVGVRQHLGEYFLDNPIAIGSTYNSHPVALASAYEGLKWTLANGLIDNAAAMQSVMTEHMDALARKHPCVRSARSLGLFGMIDLQKNSAGEPFVEYAGADHPAITAAKKALKQNGLFTLFRWSSMMCNPPLIITKDQIGEAFDKIDRSLEVVDKHFEG